MRKTELIVSGEVICPKTKASIVAHEHTNVEALLDQQNRTSSTITQSASTSKVGLGDGEDLSFCVEDGFYESAKLYGKSMVNYIQEPSSKDVVLPYEFEDGQYVTINDTKESGALGVELKGQTLVNLCKTPSTFVTMTKSSASINLNIVHNLQANKKYAVIGEISEINAPNKGLCTWVTHADGTEAYEMKRATNKGRFFFTYNVTKEIKTFRVYVHGDDRDNGGTITIGNLMLIEYQEGMENWDIPYFEGMASCKMPTLHTVGKNLFSREKVEFNKFYIIEGNLDVNNEGTFSEANGLRCLTLSLPQNENFTFSIGHPTGNLRIFASNEKPSIRVKGKKIFGTQGAKVATFNTGDYKYFTIVYYSYNSDNTSGKTEEETIATIQIEQGTVATTYEDHKASILSLPEEVVLRSLPNGVCDTFNTRTGEYIQRIGERILDGSESQWKNASISPTNIFELPMTNMKLYAEVGQIICDTLPYSYTNLQVWNTYTGVSPLAARENIVLRNNNTDTIQDLKAWLSQNPTTICYELATPVITKINLPSTLKSWNTTTHVYSEIPENTLYPILSHSNPSYPVILKPSTKYSIVANSYSNNHTNSAINFNLGGATASTTVGNRVTTITTPSTLSNELLTMSGRGNKLNNVMVIEGDVVGDEPYFEGICDCKSPILSNVGKNLFNNVFTVGGWWDGVPDCNPDFMRSVNLTPVKPNTSYAYDSTVKGHRQSANFMAHDADGNFIKYLGFGRTFTTPSNCHYIHLYAENDNSLYAQIEEGAVSTTIEPYKSNVLSANGDKIELTEAMFEQGHCGYNSSVIGSTYDEFKGVAAPSLQAIRVRSKSLVKVKPNTAYFIKADSTKYNFGMQGFDNNKLSIGYDTNWQTDHVFTTPANMHYASLHIRKNNDGNLTPTNVDYSCIQLSEVDKTIVLRSLPNGVCDTLNVETGEYVQRVGEVVLNGNETNWIISGNTVNVSGQATISFQRPFNGIRYGGDTADSLIINSDKLCGMKLAMSTSDLQYDNEYIRPYSSTSANVGIRILKSKLITQDVDGFRQYLSQNPITVQYELATPIVSTIDVQGFPYAYTNGHVQLSSCSIEQSLTPKVEYVVQTNRAGAIQANQDRLLNHDKRLAMLEDLVLHQLIQLEYNRAKCTFLSQTRQIFEGGIQMYHTKYELLSEFIEKKLYRSLEEVFEMLDVYFMLGDITDGEYDTLYEALIPSAEEIFEVEETFDHEDVEV